MKRSWIQHVRGKTNRQARVGGVGKMYEELFGRQGFSGPAAMLYHERPAGELIRIEGSLGVRSMQTRKVETADATDARADFTVLVSNSDVQVGLSQRKADMPFAYRNTDGDLLYFVHKGEGVFATEFGPIAYEPGDYVLLPKGTTFRHMPTSDDGIFYVTQSVQPIRFSEHEQVGRHVPFDPTLITVPDIETYEWPDQDEWEVRIKHSGEYSSAFYPTNPLDVIGWKGDLFPLKINIRDIIPISSDRIHLAPSSWATFETDKMMVVTFLPQTAVADLTSEELSSCHRNIDSDETILIHDHPVIGGGIFSHVPQGLVHGPKQAIRDMVNSIRKPEDRRMLTAVSVDTFAPLTPSPELIDFQKKNPEAGIGL
jgi:homogentisate 1,2-dioxygenase